MLSTVSYTVMLRRDGPVIKPWSLQSSGQKGCLSNFGLKFRRVIKPQTPKTPRSYGVAITSRLTTAELDLARLVVHRILVEDHVARQRQRQPLAVEDRAVRRQADEPVGDGDGVKQAVLEVADEHVRRPHAVELAVVQRDAAAAVLVAIERRECQPLVAPDLTQVRDEERTDEDERRRNHL